LGCPVVLAKATSLPEVAADAALYFDPLNPDDIAGKLKQVLGSETLRKKLVERGLKRAKKFSWESMAKETLATYQEAASSQ